MCCKLESSHTHIVTHTHTHMHTVTQSHTRTHTRTHSHIHTVSRTHSHTHAHTVSYMHTQSHTHAHTHSHTHTQSHTHRNSRHEPNSMAWLFCRPGGKVLPTAPSVHDQPLSCGSVSFRPRPSAEGKSKTSHSKFLRSRQGPVHPRPRLLARAQKDSAPSRFFLELISTDKNVPVSKNKPTQLLSVSYGFAQYSRRGFFSESCSNFAIRLEGFKLINRS